MQHFDPAGATAMPNQLVQARIDREVKEEASAVLAAMGLTVSDAVRLLLTRIAREKALPFRAARSQRRDHRRDEGGARRRPAALRRRAKPPRRSACRRLSRPVGSSATTSASPAVATDATFDERLAAIVRALAGDEPLEPRHRDHALSGPWADFRDCHIRPDLVLIYRKPGAQTLRLVRMGSHAELGF